MNFHVIYLEWSEPRNDHGPDHQVKEIVLNRLKRCDRGGDKIHLTRHQHEHRKQRDHIDQHCKHRTNGTANGQHHKPIHAKVHFHATGNIGHGGKPKKQRKNQVP